MRITVGIATWNRASLLRQTLNSLLRQEVPTGVTGRVIVCDNNSTDDTRRVVEQLSDRWRLDMPLGYVFEPEQGKSFALNRILTESEDNWVLFLDDDVVTQPGWLRAYIQATQRYPEAACLGGAIEPKLDGPLNGRRAFLLREYPGSFGALPIPRDTPMTPSLVAWGANMALRRDAIPAEGFSTERGMFGTHRVAGEDTGMNQDLLARGYKGWMLAAAPVAHHMPADRVRVQKYFQGQHAVGRSWAVTRGSPAPGHWGVPWWAWWEFGRRAYRAAMRWRPWPTRAYYDSLGQAAQYLGYVLSTRREAEQ